MGERRDFVGQVMSKLQTARGGNILRQAIGTPSDPIRWSSQISSYCICMEARA